MTATVTVEVVGAPKAALAETGFDGLPFAAVGGVLMLGGILAVVFATRRRSART
jgi:LPXTG-motif cell wall-anchored protein